MADSDLASLPERERALLLQGARGATEDLDLWFESLSDVGIGEAAKRAGGFWVTRSEPPMLGGMSERFDVITSMSGLPNFADEYSNAKELEVDGVRLHVLPLARIIASKRTANRAKDQATLHSLETALRVIEAIEAKRDQ